MAVLLTAAGLWEHAGRLYALGILATGALLLYEDRVLATVENIFALNERIFTLNAAVFNANMIFSVVFLATTLAAFTLA